MRSFLLPPAAIAALIAAPATARAQPRGESTRDTVPLSMFPPAGKCRIWMEGVPAAQQPAPTDCATAVRQKPANGTVLYPLMFRGSTEEPFDPKAGDASKRDGLERDGSAAERELRRQRETGQSTRRSTERQEALERARQSESDRVNNAVSQPVRGANANSRGNSGSGSGNTGRTAQPRTESSRPATGSSSGSSAGSSAGSSGASARAPSEPTKPPPAAEKKKPE